MEKLSHILTFLIVAWFMSIVTFATWLVLTTPVEIPASTAAVLGTIYGIPALAAGLWKWSGDKMIEIKLDDTITGTRQTIDANDEGVYVFEFNPKKHVIHIKSR